MIYLKESKLEELIFSDC